MVRTAFPSRRFLSRSSAATASKVLALAVAFGGLGEFLDDGGVLSLA
jgi:hypothetical protein